MNWQDLHQDSIVIDLHNHSVLKNFLFGRGLSGKKQKFLSTIFKRVFWPFSERNNFPLMKKGGLDVILSTCYIPEVEWLDDQSLVKFALKLSPSTRKRVFDPTYFDATRAMMDSIELEIDAYNSTTTKKIVLAKNPKELKKFLIDGETVMVHSVEGAHSLQGELCGKRPEDAAALPPLIENEVLQNLEYLADRGVAYLTLAHFYPNQIANPVFPYPEYGIKRGNWEHLMSAWDMNKGLTPLGKKVVKRMLELGVLIDVAHCTPKARSEVYEIVGDRKSCVLSSHSGVFEINRDPYNLEDWELKWFAEHECVVGIIFMNYWLSPTDTSLGLKYIEQTMNHMKNTAGSGIIGIGTDFDGFTDPPDEITDISQLPRITRYLSSLRNGIGSKKYTDEEIKNILGGNSLRLLLDGWKNERK